MTEVDIIGELDKAAASILKRANGEGRVEGEVVPLKDQIAAFESITKWAELRAKIAPDHAPDDDGKGGSRFGRLRDRYKDDAPVGRARTRAKANGATRKDGAGDPDPDSGGGALDA